MSTKIDLTLGIKIDSVAPSTVEKNANPEEQQGGFQLILDEAVLSRAASEGHEKGKESPVQANAGLMAQFETKDMVQKNLESSRVIITTESNLSEEELELFAKNQGFASSSLSNLLNKNESSENSNDKLSTGNNPPDLTNSNLKDSGSHRRAPLVFDKASPLQFKSFQDHDSIKAIEREGFALAKQLSKKENSMLNESDKIGVGLGSLDLEKIAHSPDFDKTKPSIKPSIESTALLTLSQQHIDTEKVKKVSNNKVPFDNVSEPSLEDVVIKRVQLQKGNVYNKLNETALKMHPIRLLNEESELLEITRKMVSPENSSRITIQDQGLKINPTNSTQNLTTLDTGQTSSNDSRVKSEEQPNNLNRFNQIQTISSKFADSLANRLTSQINQGAWKVEMEIHPKSLGKVSVQMEMVNGNLEAQFFTNQSVTRDLILESMPRLREMLENNGTNHAEVSVELKNDGNNDRKFVFTDSPETEPQKNELNEVDKEESAKNKISASGRYDFLV